MDPNVNLQEQLRLAQQLIDAVEDGQTVTAVEAGRLAALVLALDEWIDGGGFLPKRWDSAYAKPEVH